MSNFTPIQKIFKNRTGITLIIAGVEITDGEDFILPKSQWAKTADDYAQWTTYIDAQTLIISDGTSDLSPERALQFLQILAIGGDGNFSWNVIDEGSVVNIPKFQQMNVYEELELNDQDGELSIDGDLVIFE